jgi:hypothetical protein
MHPIQNPATGSPAGPSTMGIDLTPADILRGAALYLQRHGWTQGEYIAYRPTTDDPFPPACAHGAIAVAAYGHATDDPYNDLDGNDAAGRRLFGRAVDFFDDHIVRTTVDLDTIDPDDDGFNAVRWNDSSGRTDAEVIAALHVAADEWDHTHGGAR